MCSCVLLDGQLLIALTKDEQFHSQKVSSSPTFPINESMFLFIHVQRRNTNQVDIEVNYDCKIYQAMLIRKILKLMDSDSFK